jgi:tripartite ATP-independent transporter DctM subunit
MSFRKVASALMNSLLALGVPVVVIGGIIFGIVTATEAAVLSVLYSLALGLFVYRTIGIRDLPRIFRGTAELACLPLFALASASVFSYLLAYFRLPTMLMDLLGDVPTAALLPVIMLCWLIIGTFLDALPAMVLMIPLFAPLVEAAGIDPVHYGVVSVMGLALGLVTPPYGLCLLLASTIAGIPILEGIKHLLPFFLGILAVIFLATFVPQLTLWLPDQVLQMTR